MNGGDVSKLDAPMCGLNFEETAPDIHFFYLKCTVQHRHRRVGRREAPGAGSPMSGCTSRRSPSSPPDRGADPGFHHLHQGPESAGVTRFHEGRCCMYGWSPLRRGGSAARCKPHIQREVSSAVDSRRLGVMTTCQGQSQPQQAEVHVAPGSAGRGAVF